MKSVKPNAQIYLVAFLDDDLRRAYDKKWRLAKTP